MFEPVFDDSNPHCEIELHKPPIVRENSSNWYVGPTANADPSKPPDTTTGDTAAHQFGHLVGLEDEYRLTKSEFNGSSAATRRWRTRTRTSATRSRLMSAGQADVEERHLKPFIDWLNANKRSGEKPYKLVAGP